MTDSLPIVAVLFGGRSVEHDVSILTGLQFMEALDVTRYRVLPIYVAPDGQWWTGDALRKRTSYPLKEGTAQAVTLPVGTPTGSRPHLLAPRKGLMGNKVDQIPFDVLVPAVHGSHGEDGSLQGLLAFNGIAHAGCDALSSAATMDKHFTKTHLRGLGVPVLDHALVTRPDEGQYLQPTEVEATIMGTLGPDPFPLVVKPRRLGSSIGVRRVTSLDELMAGLVAIFRIDTAALVEPAVPNLVEYNVAVRRNGASVLISTIERPTGAQDILDFNAKYQAGGSKSAAKADTALSDGMASANRVLNPEELTQGQRQVISDAATTAGIAFDLRGSVRIDFLCDGQTGDLWLNEINSVPGSFAYYLWQAAEPALSFTDLTTAIVDEGLNRHRTGQGETTALSGGAQLFGRE